MRRMLTALAAFAAFVYLGAALAGTGTTPPVASTDDAVPTATDGAAVETAPADSASLTLTLPPGGVVYAQRVEARGFLVPALPGEQIVLELGSGETWTTIAQGAVDAYGAYAIPFDAVAAGTVRARALASGAVSSPLPLRVSPVVRVRVTKAVAFGRTTVTAVVAPTSYTARVRAVLRQDGKVLSRGAARIRGGRVTLSLRVPAVGASWLELRFPASDGFTERTAGAKVLARGRTLSVGSEGPDVLALRSALARLRFYVPAPSRSFGYELVDSVLAFQKAYGLERTGSVDAATWRMLERARPLRPRHRAPARHLEVDKTRQILLVVDKGKVVRVLPVSTGATGNTPEGRHAVRWKAPATTTWLGPGILYRTLTFYGNAFAIHGWSSVPSYPASHGCVRIPIFMADWLYNRTPVGETVYVYR